jgi:hypothetical protein
MESFSVVTLIPLLILNLFLALRILLVFFGG